MLSWVHCSNPEAAILLVAYVLSFRFEPGATPFGLGDQAFGNATIVKGDMMLSVGQGRA
jgi:hypothetical protein